MPQIRALFLLLSLYLSASTSVFALTLGDAKVQSQLGMPMKIELELKNLGKIGVDQLQIGLATAKQHEHLGVERKFAHTDFQFSVNEDAKGLTILHVTSRKPITEPYLNFVVFVRWPQGDLLKEVIVLFDAP